jgi:hypothetical protein
MPALEETLGPLACAKRLRARSAPEVLACRDGSRSGRGALDAVRDRTVDRQDGRDGSLGAAEVTGGCDPLAPPWLVDRWRVRLDDRALRPLSRQGLKARMVEPDGQGVPPETGTPQGGPVSPVLAQGSLHDARDLWGEHGVKPPGRGEARRCRDAEDWGGAFRWQEDAERVCRV